MARETIKQVALAPRVEPHPCRKCGCNLVHVARCSGGSIGTKEHIHCPRSTCRYINPPPAKQEVA